MKCPSCGYNTFDTNERCKRCGALLSASKWKNRLRFFKESSPDIDNSQDLESKNLFGEKQIPIDINDDPIVLENEVDEQTKDNYHIVSKSVRQAERNSESDTEESYLTLASFKRRFFAFIFDLILIVLISFVTLIFGLFAAGYDPVKGMVNLSYIIFPVYIILTLLASTYLLFLHAYSGKTVGKLIFGIRVVKEDGSVISLSDSFVRWIGYYFSALPLFYGYISALFDFNYQTWHDKLSKSYVIKEN